VAAAAGADYGVAGFAERYDASRPGTAPVVADLLCQYARVGRPELVVDLGCGPGRSTAIWAARAARGVGIEAQPAMLALARRRLTAPHIELRLGSA
jgi:trans-aconitate methyltransferase